MNATRDVGHARRTNSDTRRTEEHALYSCIIFFNSTSSLCLTITPLALSSGLTAGTTQDSRVANIELVISDVFSVQVQ